jgi:type I restriction enzyme S subunit
MGSDWPEVILEDVADELTVGYVGPMSSEYVDEGIPFLRSLNVEPLRINKNDLKFISPQFHQRIRKSRLTPGDVVIVRTGKPGACCVVPEWLAEANCSDLVIVRCGKQLDKRFLAYYVNTVAAGHVAAHLVDAVQQHFNVGSARTLKIRLPSLEEQESIAHILGTLDDKIESNRRMNVTLEAMARVLFQSWFVDFDPVRAKLDGRQPPGLDPTTAALFPDSFQASELGHTPKGWEIVALENLASIRGGRQLPTEDCLPIGRFTVFGANGIMGYATESTHEGFVIAFGRVGAYCGSIHWSPHGAWINNNASAVVPLQWPTFVLQTMLNIDFNSMRTGSAQPFIPNSSLASARVLRPSPSIAEAFCQIVDPLRRQQANNEKQSGTLATLRDTLLPKLLSGEINIKLN